MESRNLIISRSEKGNEIALLENKRLMEYHIEKADQVFSVGDVYWATVKKINPGLNAAFVDIGYEKDAFLHYLDLGPQFKALKEWAELVNQKQTKFTKLSLKDDLPKGGKINEYLEKGARIPVQIVKEPISTKGHRLTTEFSFPGRFVVLVPFQESISVSKKIKNAEERKRLKDIIQNVKSKHFGVIIRTAAEFASAEDLMADMADLNDKWLQMASRLAEAKTAPLVLHTEVNRTTSIIRDLLNSSFESIIVDDVTVQNEVANYLKTVAPDQLEIVKLHKSKTPLFEEFEVDKQIKSGFGKTVTIAGGAYIVIEHTEALHVIDVNSGNRIQASSLQEEQALKTNLEAASEIARQVRLRDLGGIIVVDFIDMRNANNKRVLFEHLTELMKADRAKHTILPPSKFGLVQITRQRVRQQVEIDTAEVCPTCHGTGFARPTDLIIDDIYINLKHLVQTQNQKHLTLHVHPFVAAFLTIGGLKSKRIKWFWKMKTWVKIEIEKSYPVHEYHFSNPDTGKINI